MEKFNIFVLQTIWRARTSEEYAKNTRQSLVTCHNWLIALRLRPFNKFTKLLQRNPRLGESNLILLCERFTVSSLVRFWCDDCRTIVKQHTQTSSIFALCGTQNPLQRIECRWVWSFNHLLLVNLSIENMYLHLVWADGSSLAFSFLSLYSLTFCWYFIQMGRIFTHIGSKWKLSSKLNTRIYYVQMVQ